MVFADVEFRAQRLLGPLALLEEFQLAQHVAAGLARPHAIALDLGDGFAFRIAQGVDIEFQGLFAAPFQAMHAAVHHQPHAAEHGVVQLPDGAEGIVLIHADLHRHLLGIQRPAFDIGAEPQRLADQRQLGFLRDRDLHVMAGDRLVEGEGRQHEARHFGGIAQVDPVDAGPLSVQRGAVVIAAGRRSLDVLGHALDHHIGLGQGDEQLGQLGPHLLHLLVQVGDQLFLGRVGVGIKLLGILVEARQALAHRALGHAMGLHDGVDLGGMVAHDVHAGLVDLLRRQAGGRPIGQRVPVILFALGQLPHARVMGGLFLHLLHQRDLAIQRGIDLVFHRFGGGSAIVAGELGLFGAAHHRFRQRRFVGIGAAQLGHRHHQLVQGKVRRDHAHRHVMAGRFDFLVQRFGKGAKPRHIGIGIGPGLDGVLGVQEAGPVDGIAAELAEDIGLAGRGGTIVEALRRFVARRQAVQHHIVVRLVLAADRIAIKSLQTLKLAGLQRLQLGDAGERGIVDQRLLVGARALVQAQRRDADGRQIQLLLHEDVEQIVQRLGAAGGGEGAQGGHGNGSSAGLQRMATVKKHGKFPSWLRQG